MNEVAIVSNSYRGMVDMGNLVYVYIPMTAEEIEKFGCKNIVNACWRISVWK